MDIARCRLAKMYKNLNGSSMVAAYETGRDFIKVELRDGSIVKFSFRSAGFFRVRAMKKLAAEGQGLGTFILQKCRIPVAD